ncbi:HAD-like protein [Viridothelium virens]|uniref:HAD-like protein n=1 Tax=Viridothelium virens TaxID=1048519 RepID=A0A6A6HIN1_VIRVR|nr:HAD-like protein [Viridothelium virens]
MSTTKTKDLKSFRALSFDIFGTLVDDESGLYDTLMATTLVQSLPESHPLRTSRSALLNHFFQVSDAAQQSHPNEHHLPLAYTQLSEELAPGRDKATVATEAAAFASCPATFPAFPDTAAAMQLLASHYKLIPLTNMDTATFAAVCWGPLAGVHFDAVYTAEDIGSYKPDLRNFEYLLQHLKDDFGVEKGELLHVAQSLHADHVPANQMGLRNCYVVRNSVTGKELERQPEVEWKVDGLEGLAKLVEEAWRDE